MPAPRLMCAGVLTMMTAFGAVRLGANEDRLIDATITLEEIMAVPEHSIPRDLFTKASCVVIVPGLKKGAFIIGGKYGRGYLACRKSGGGWSAPGAVIIEGGSVGFQLGGEESDLVMLVMNARGVDHLLSTKFTLGGEAAAAAGPVGRQASAQTDASMRAEMLAWSRTRGVFAGISLEGATLREDRDENRHLYRKQLSNRTIVTGTVKPPKAADELMALLKRY